MDSIIFGLALLFSILLVLLVLVVIIKPYSETTYEYNVKLLLIFLTVLFWSIYHYLTH